ncbi:MAG: M23 family metallopeptidase [Robiginitomaculum sp.]|nr:M23 family metallopeptidase [Robiginitomaculum sp.]
MLKQAIYAQLIILIVTLIWFAFSKRRSFIDSALKIFCITSLLAGLWLGGVWFYPPLYGLLIFTCLFAVLMVLHFKQSAFKSGTLRSLISNTPILALLPLSSFLIWHGVTGRLNPSGDFVDLQSPFQEGAGACVLSGGISPLLNFHIFPSDSPQDLAQTYALDIVKTRKNGFRTKRGYTLNPKPNVLENYEIFGTDITSPCSGLVVEYENGLPDQPIGGSDKINTGGNGVVLKCDNLHIHLHHMKKGSLSVRLGDKVVTGQHLGQVGNSGNTIEPHLHLHAETIVQDGNTNAHGKPIHMRFKGKYMARGACF